MVVPIVGTPSRLAAPLTVVDGIDGTRFFMNIGRVLGGIGSICIDIVDAG